MAAISIDNHSGFDIERSGLFHPLASIVGWEGADRCYDLLNSTSTYGNGDVQIRVHDNLAGLEPEVAFSIKSRIGSSPTLLNASWATNFIYELVGEMDSKTVAEFNSEKRYADKFAVLERCEVAAKYAGLANSVFEGNLMMIDTMMPEMLAEMLLYRYSSKTLRIADVVELMESENPLGFPQSASFRFYEHKVKNLLAAVALGMLPHTPWDGLNETAGDYIVVREDSDIVCYHIYNKNQLKDYLYRNTRFDTPSSRNDFGQIYSESGRMRLKLNAQIRFR